MYKYSVSWENKLYVGFVNLLPTGKNYHAHRNIFNEKTYLLILEFSKTRKKGLNHIRLFAVEYLFLEFLELFFDFSNEYDTNFLVLKTVNLHISNNLKW